MTDLPRFVSLPDLRVLHRLDPRRDLRTRPTLVELRGGDVDVLAERQGLEPGAYGMLMASNALRICEPWEPVVARRAAEAGVPPSFALGTLYAESRGNPRAFRQEPDGSTGVGLFQLTHKGVKGGYPDEQLYDPVLNTELALRVMAKILRAVRTLPEMASCYNAGGQAGPDGLYKAAWPSDVSLWGLRETVPYIDGVVGASNALIHAWALRAGLPLAPEPPLAPDAMAPVEDDGEVA